MTGEKENKEQVSYAWRRHCVTGKSNVTWYCGSMKNKQGVNVQQKTKIAPIDELKGKQRIKRKHLQHRSLSSKSLGH